MRAAVRMLPAVVVLIVAGAVAAPAQEEPVPEDYDAAEFAPALHHLRRGEIIAVGAFPFALVLSTIVYDYARWAGDGFAESTAPFARALDQDPFDNDEKVGIALAAVGVAIAVAVADYLIGQGTEPPRYAEPAAVADHDRKGIAPAAFAVAAPHAALLPPSLASLWPHLAPSPAPLRGPASLPIMDKADPGAELFSVCLVVAADGAGQRADRYLSARSGLPSRNQFQQRLAHLRVNGRVAKASTRLEPGDHVEAALTPPPASAVLPESMELEVLYEDADAVVLNKPGGLVVHPGSGNRSGTLVNGLLHRYRDLARQFPDSSRPGIVHRLDKDTSGRDHRCQKWHGSRQAGATVCRAPGRQDLLCLGSGVSHARGGPDCHLSAARSAQPVAGTRQPGPRQGRTDSLPGPEVIAWCLAGSAAPGDRTHPSTTRPPALARSSYPGRPAVRRTRARRRAAAAAACATPPHPPARRPRAAHIHGTVAARLRASGGAPGRRSPTRSWNLGKQRPGLLPWWRRGCSRPRHGVA